MLRTKVTKRKLLQSAAFALTAAVAIVALPIIRTIREIPEAYAAWDTGTLLTTYLAQNDGKWPSGWDDLATEIEDGKPMLFSPSDDDGNRLSDTAFIDKLRSMVIVDWSYQPIPGNASSPVTRVDGAAFRTVWVDAEPNEMVRSFVAHQAREKQRAKSFSMQLSDDFWFIEADDLSSRRLDRGRSSAEATVLDPPPI
ncbi:MAG: hypothetical protein EA381_06140 [Planctomycetaceae bacterium]|nr:MAG: hypothetical protein EA381_06140 [Planctomycetaceae bacterium]